MQQTKTLRPRRLDLEGMTFGRLKVQHRASPVGALAVFWHCVCECGGEKDIIAASLTKGATRSCGCWLKEATRIRFTKHGHARHGHRTPTYGSYVSARKRCNNPAHKDYYLYGGRGIRFLFASFEDFYAELGTRPSGFTVDRKDPNGNYVAGNVQWATPKAQQYNKRRKYGKAA